MTDAFHAYVMDDLLGGVAGITSRAMFGGWGLYRDGVTFGIIADGELYFKVDDKNRPQYEKKESEPFVYASRGKQVTMKSYWKVPADVMEDREELLEWIDASCRAAKAKRVNSVPHRKKLSK